MRWKIWKIIAVPKFKILTKKRSFVQAIQPDTRPDFTMQRTRQICLATGQCIIWSCEFCMVKCNVSIYERISYKLIQSFFQYLILWNWAYKTDDWPKDTFNVGKFVFDNNNQERMLWFYLGRFFSRSLIVLLSQLFVIFLLSLVAFGEINYWKRLKKWLSRWEICVAQHCTFYPHRDYKRFKSDEKWCLSTVGQTIRDKKSFFINNRPEIGTYQPKSDQIYFLTTLAATLLCYAKGIDKLVFVQNVNFDNIGSLKNNGTKYLT